MLSKNDENYGHTNAIELVHRKRDFKALTIEFKIAWINQLSSECGRNFFAITGKNIF